MEPERARTIGNRPLRLGGSGRVQVTPSSGHTTNIVPYCIGTIFVGCFARRNFVMSRSRDRVVISGDSRNASLRTEAAACTTERREDYGGHQKAFPLRQKMQRKRIKNATWAHGLTGHFAARVKVTCNLCRSDDHRTIFLRFAKTVIEDVQPYAVTMTDMIRDAGVKQPLPTRGVGEKPATDFGYVGIDAILEQMRKKAMKQGFELNIMVVGQSGLGKSTLINTLFKSKVSRKSVQPTAEERIPKTIEIKSITHDVEEKGVRMKLTVIDTPGFGDHINNENCWLPIMKFINDQYEKYLQEELNINRKKRIPDSRVHCCIYFIPATGHS
ncbi:unnamed protein product [Ranitomeya imitator]|uniref:Septin-type G domain-containing protein n=1 Tax=Ranitomeya imitator TaxID=111125 RepID=A0ABN9MMX1_9NEOB|nr:unnamed protein product [Ranitomeya imitator]